MRADLVAGPNVVVSSPLDPGPVIVTVYPLELSSICSCLTSSPLLPMVSDLVNVYVDVGVVVIGVLGIVLVDREFSRDIVCVSNIPVLGIDLDVWKRIRASLVAGPKYSDSYPLDPGPVVVTVYP